MKWHFSLAVTLSLALAATSAHAEDHAIAGAGSIACAQFMKAEQSQDKITTLAVVTWLQGFLSGVNMQRNLDLKIPLQVLPSGVQIKAFTVQYCTDHPDKSVFESAMWLSLQKQPASR